MALLVLYTKDDKMCVKVWVSNTKPLRIKESETEGIRLKFLIHIEKYR